MPLENIKPAQSSAIVRVLWLSNVCEYRYLFRIPFRGLKICMVYTLPRPHSYRGRLDIHLKHVWFTPERFFEILFFELDIHLKYVWFTPLGLDVGEFQPYTEKISEIF